MHSLRSLTLTRTRSGGASEEHAAAGVKSEARARSSTRCASRVSVREMPNGGESATALRQSCNVFAKVLVPPRLRAHLPLPSALCVQTPKAPFAALPSSCNRPAAAVGGLASSLCPARVAPHPLTSPTRSPPHQRVPRTAAAGRRRGGGQRDAGDNWCAERQDGPDARDATITRSRVQRPHQSPTVRHLRLAPRFPSSPKEEGTSQSRRRACLRDFRSLTPTFEMARLKVHVHLDRRRRVRAACARVCASCSCHSSDCGPFPRSLLGVK